MDNLFDNAEGEDSGLEFEDTSAGGPPSDDLIPPGNYGINEAAEDADEGIGVSMLNQTPDVIDGALPPPEQFAVAEPGIQPPHLQVQQAHDEFMAQQQELEQAAAAAVIPDDQEPNEQQEDPDDLLAPAGDDNNNDRPDDVNNNTTDPALQELQRQQHERRLQQQELLRQQRANAAEQEANNARLLTEQNAQQESKNDERRGGTEGFIENGGSSNEEKKDKNKKKKKRKKKNKQATANNANKTNEENAEGNENTQPTESVEIEYVPEKLELSVFDPLYRAFANVFENFKITDPEKAITADEDVKPTVDELNALKKVPKIDLEEEIEEKKEDEKPKLSKRKLKKLTRLSVAELKQQVPRPDVVEMHDVTAKDPKLLVHLKAYRNTVPVPRHWCYKRKYLQGKRGIEKAPFDLPGFIKKTGIMEMRAALAEKEETKTLKAKMRERVRPKMGKIDVDYQKLHDAFFKWQSKPKMTIHGDLYYEGKEFETRMKDKKPGELSDDLRTALGMPVGPNSHRVPPPWLIAMQRYGPPPSYPHLKVAGLNAPIPEGCSFGYHAGGWGKPPVDEFGRPLYGDVFGVMSSDASGTNEDDAVDKELWGEMESEEEAESSSEEEEEEDEEGDEDDKGEVEESGLQTPAEGLATPSGFSSVPIGSETPDMIELRKRRIEQDIEGGDTPSLYTVLPEKRVDRLTGSMMASTHVYDIAAAAKEKDRRSMMQKDSSAVELALDPSELDLVDTAAMEARYEQTIKEKQATGMGEDLSDMVAEHAARQKNKRKRQLEQQDAKKSKKQKEFKF